MAEKTPQKDATRPKSRQSKAFVGVNSRAEALEKFKNNVVLGNPNNAGEIYDYMIAMGMTPAGDFMPPVKKRTMSYTGDSREYVKKRAENSRELLDKKAEGGKVTGYKDGGCVMSGRGGKYKGMK
jgi:hypothetical protein